MTCCPLLALGQTPEKSAQTSQASEGGVTGATKATRTYKQTAEDIKHCGKGNLKYYPKTKDCTDPAYRKQLEEMDAEFAKEIWPRDIFHVMEKKPLVNLPIRGWKLKFDLLIDSEASIDYQEYVITATKEGQTRYFHVSEKSGVERETGQSLHEIRVKEIDSHDEDWSHNKYWDEGEWSGEKGKSKHWVQSGPDKTQGWCSEWEMAFFPVTKEDCFKPNEVQHGHDE